ncbi:MAG: protease modulator HflC [Minwuia sp.]|uniref:protease modulator HflC n=1 Tax=Minwuia sp. TaxID=2493630 RepID=UPI003A8A1AD9
MRIVGIALGVLILIVGIVGYSAIYTVHQTQQAIVLQFGNPVNIVSEPGLNFKVPFIQDVVYLEKRILSLDAEPEEIITADQKRLVVDVFTRFRITEPLEFYKAYQTMAAAANRLDTEVASTLRRELAKEQFTALLTGERSELMQRLSNQVGQRMARNGIEVVDVRIKRADLPEQNKDAIFQRMRTEREREAKEERALGDEEGKRIRAKADKDRTVLLAEARKQSEILRGEGDGARAAIFNRVAAKNPEFYSFYRSLQAYRESLNSEDTTLVLNPRSDFFKFFSDISPVGPGGSTMPSSPLAVPSGASSGEATPNE